MTAITASVDPMQETIWCSPCGKPISKCGGLTSDCSCIRVSTRHEPSGSW